MLNQIYFEIDNGEITKLYYGDSLIKYIQNNDIIISYEPISQDINILSLLNAITIRTLDTEINVFVDHYSSIPLFYTEIGNKIIFSNIFNLVANKTSENIIDDVGFWESYLYETPLLDRTLFKNIKVVQAGHFLNITQDKTIQKQYFYFNYQRSRDIDYNEEGYNCLLKNIKFNAENRKIIFPLSGGVDSRLLLGLFKKKHDNHFVEAVTYGYEKSSLEFKYAKKLLKYLDINCQNHEFHKLDADSYTSDLDYMAEITGGLIGAQNSHLLGYLMKAKRSKDTLCISGFFADSIFGYASIITEKNNIKNSKYYTLACKYYKEGIINDEIFKGIEDDMNILHKQWTEKSNLESFTEFLYIKERTTKFHMQLYNLYRTIVDVQMPFFQENIIDCLMSYPSDIKNNKKIIFDILDNHFPEIKSINNISSSGRFGSGKGQGMTKLNYYSYLFLTAITRTLNSKLGIPIKINNPYDTENQDYIFLKNYQNIFLKKLNYLQSTTLFDSGQKIVLSKRFDGMRNFQLITNATLFKKYINKH